MTPQLRFPEFTDKLRVEKLGSITKWSSGGTPPKENPKYWGGDIPWISAASMYGKVFDRSDRTLTEEGGKNGSKIAKQGSVLLLVRGSMLFNAIPVGIAGKDVAFNQDVKAITSNEADQNYLYYFLKASEHKLLSQVVGTGIGAGKLDTDQLQSMTVSLPQKSEQQKIAEFLGGVDSKLTSTQTKVAAIHEYKKGIMQALFSGKLRFKDENGNPYPNWEEKKLGDLMILRSERNSIGEVSEVFSVAKNAGVINQIEHLGRSFASSDISNYKIVHPGDVVYTKSPTSDFPYGIIKQNKLGRSGVVSVLYGVYTPINDATGYLLDTYFSSWVNTYNYLNPIVQKGAKNTINIGDSAFLEGRKILFPTDEREQQKIANLLSALDDKIKLEEAKLARTKEFKKALLQRMFI